MVKRFRLGFIALAIIVLIALLGIFIELPNVGRQYVFNYGKRSY